MNAIGLLLGFDVGIGAELQIDAPDVVGLAVHQRRLAGMERRVEPEPPLGRKIRGHAHVGDQELVLERHAGEVRGPADRARSSARRRRRSPSRRRSGSGPSGVSTVRRAPSLRCSRPTTRLLQRRSMPVDLARAVDQRLLQIELLEIDEGRHLVAFLRQEIEREHQVVAAEDLAELPGDAAAPPAVRRRRAGRRISSVRFDQQMPREPSPMRSESSSSTTGTPCSARSIAAASPTGPGADHDHRMARDRARVLVGRAAVGEVEQRLVFGCRGHGPLRALSPAAPPTSRGRARRSRSPASRCRAPRRRRARR